MSEYAFDLEVFKNFFSATFVNMNDDNDIKQFYIWSDKDGLHNDYVKLYNFITKNVKTLIGYNNIGYDNVILSYIFVNSANFMSIDDFLNAVYEYSNKIIKLQKDRTHFDNDDIFEFNKYYYYKHSFDSIDLMKILNHDKLKKSLKQTLININFPFIESLPKDPESRIAIHEIQDVLKYNLNDAKGTKYLAKFIKDEIISRIIASKKYKVNLMNASRPKLAHEILAIEYSKRTNLERRDFENLRTHHRIISLSEIVDKRIKFKLDNLKTLYKEIINLNLISIKELDFNIKINNLSLSIKAGGLHSEDNPEYFESNDEYILIDCDVASFYPRNIVNLRIKPKHLSYKFIEIIESKTNERLLYKKLAKEKNININMLDDVIKELSKTIPINIILDNLSNIEKIVINSIFGGFGSEFKFWYDRSAMLKTTVNGQLMLLMLIEELIINDFEVISVNTDGILTKVKKDKEDLYKTICESWASRFNLELEYTYYKKYVRRDVNCYVAQTTEGKLKLKGDFNPDNSKDYKRSGSFPGFDRSIIGIAIINYYINNIPVKDTIYNHIRKDYDKSKPETHPIFDYCSSQKADSKFKFELHKVENGIIKIENLQKDLRFYISKNGGKLYKRDTNTNSLTALFKDFKVTPFNNFIELNPDEYNIDYNHYIQEVEKIIAMVDMKTNDKRVINKYIGNYKIDFDDFPY